MVTMQLRPATSETQKATRRGSSAVESSVMPPTSASIIPTTPACWRRAKIRVRWW